MRSVVPVYLQFANTVVSTPADVEALRVNDPEAYEKMVLSGDLGIFYDGLVMLDDAERAARERNALVEKVRSGDTRILLPGPLPPGASDAELVAGKYHLPDTHAPLRVLGYHVQKSVVVLTRDTVIDCDEVDFRYLSFIAPARGTRLLIRGRTAAYFAHVVFGGVSVEFADESRLHLEDVTFSGVDTPVRQRGRAVLERNDRVAFRNTRVHYHFERFEDATAPVFDRNDPLVFREVLTYSQIDNYVFECDTDFSSLGEMEINRPVRFTAPEGDRVQVALPKLRLMRDTAFDLSVLLVSDIRVNEISSVRFSLGLFAGRLETDNASDIVLESTVFVLDDPEMPQVSFKDSDVRLKGVSTSDIHTLFNATGSKITIAANSNIRNVQTLVRFYEIARTAEESIFELENELRLEDSAVECERLYHYTGTKEKGRPLLEILRSQVLGLGAESLWVRRRFRAEDSDFRAKAGIAVIVDGAGRAMFTRCRIHGSAVGIRVSNDARVRLVGCRLVENETALQVQSGMAMLDGKNLFERNLKAIDLLPCGETCTKPSTVYDLDSAYKENESKIDKVEGSRYVKTESAAQYQERLDEEGCGHDEAE